MNKYTLNFKEKEIESNYQSLSQQRFRMFTLKMLTVGYIVVTLIKIGENILVQSYDNIHKSCAFIFYMLIQYGIIKKRPKYIRVAIILLNHFMAITFSLQQSEKDDTYSSYLKGVNVMGANYSMFISGEFLDAAVSTLTIGILRLILVQVQTNIHEIYTIISSLLIIFYTIRCLYHYHKAKRNQYLLSLNDTQWEKILNSIAFKQPCIIFSFIEDTMKFELKSEAQCHKIFNRQFNGMSFIRDSAHKGISLENFLFMQIKKYRIDRASVFNKTLVVEYQKKLIRIECSIYYGNKPTILLLIRDYLNEKKLDMSIYEQRHQNFIKLLLKILSHIHKLNSFQCRIIQRKLLILQLYEDLRLYKFRESEINIYNFAQMLQNFYFNLSIKAIVSGNCKLNTISNVFLLVILIIAENSRGTYFYLNLFNEVNNQIWLEISGNFDIFKVKKILQEIQNYIKLISQNVILEEQKIQFKLTPQIFLPFQINEVNSKSS